MKIPALPKQLSILKKSTYGVPNYIIAGGIAIIGYYLYTKSGTPTVLPTTGSVGVVSDIPFSVFPEVISPASTFTIQGSCVDYAGNAVSVAKIYYYIYEDNGPGGVNRLITSGIAAENANSFARTISTVGYNPGTYTVTISDTPVGTVPQTLPTSTFEPSGQNNAPFSPAADLSNVSVGAEGIIVPAVSIS
jgi:hypothetical protein